MTQERNVPLCLRRYCAKEESYSALRRSMVSDFPVLARPIKIVSIVTSHSLFFSYSITTPPPKTDPIAFFSPPCYNGFAMNSDIQE